MSYLPSQEEIAKGTTPGEEEGNYIDMHNSENHGNITFDDICAFNTTNEPF